MHYFNNYNCLIVEDEPLAIAVLKDYISEYTSFQQVFSCCSTMEAKQIMNEHKIDVMFLDIHLPKQNGIEFLRTMKGAYQVILTTAYHQFALEAYNLNVVDYLLKPIEPERFLQAITKLKIPDLSFNENTLAPAKAFYFNVDKKQVKIKAADIMYVEGLKDYVRIYTTEKRIVTKFVLSDLLDFLNDTRFIRIHKSYIINRDFVKAFTAAEVELTAVKLPLGRTFKRGAIEAMKAKTG